MIDILSYLPAKRKQSSSGWISFNAPCCVHNGESADKRQRGGMKVAPQGWSYHCFNCGFKTSFILGRHLSFKARRFLQWLGVPQEEIDYVNLESLKHKNIEGLLEERQQVVQSLMSIEFEERDLPAHVDFLEPNTPYWDYLKNRCVPMDYPYMTEGKARAVGPIQVRKAIVVPFTHNGHIVGYSKRFLDDRNPRYVNDIQHGYVFGVDLQHPDWKHVIVVEGVFDALSINGLAVLHAEINDAQVKLIRSLGKEITVVPDQDEAGLKLIDRALELGWAVSIPNWGEGIKDVNDAVRKYGKAATMLSVFEARNTSKIKIEIARRNLQRKLNV